MQRIYSLITAHYTGECFQAGNQEFFRAGQVSETKEHAKERPRWEKISEISEIFFLDTLKTAF